MRPTTTPAATRPRARSRRHAPASAHALLEPFEPRILLDSVPFGLATGDADDFDDERTSVVVVRNNDLTLFTQDDGDDEWSRQDLSSFLPGNFIPDSALSFQDPADERTYHAVNGPEGLAILLDDDDAGLEDFRILTDEIDGALPISTGITTFTTPEDLVHIAGLTSAGELVIYRQTGERQSVTRADWEFINISRDQLAPRGIATPAFRTDLTSFATPWNALSFVGIDAAGDIQAVWLAPSDDNGDNGDNGDVWNVTNISDIAGTPPLSGNLAAFAAPWGGINIAGIDTAGDLLVTWWVPQFGGDWEVLNLSDTFGGPSLIPGTAFASQTPWGGLNIGGLSATGDAALFWWVPEFGPRWEVTTDLVPGAEDFSLEGANSFTSPAGTINIVGTTPADAVLRYSWRPGEPWRAENLDAIAEDENDSFDDNAGPDDPDLVPLSDTWRVTTSTGFFADDFDDDFNDDGITDDFGDFDDFEDQQATILLNADGTWTTSSGDLEFPGLDADITRGTWTFSNGTVTIVIPSVGTLTANNVSPNASQFVTQGVFLTPGARTRLENAIDDFDASFPDANLREDINNRGGLDAVLDDIDLLWTRTRSLTN